MGSHLYSGFQVSGPPLVFILTNVKCILSSKTMVFLVSLVLYKRSLPALPSFIEDIISSSSTDQVCKKLKWYTSVKVKKKTREIHTPPSHKHTHTFSTPKWLDALTKSLLRHTPLKIKRRVNNPYRIIIYNFGKYYGKLRSIGDTTISKRVFLNPFLLAY